MLYQLQFHGESAADERFQSVVREALREALFAAARGAVESAGRRLEVLLEDNSGADGGEKWGAGGGGMEGGRWLQVECCHVGFK